MSARLQRVLVVLLASALSAWLWAAVSPPANAVILPATTIDGPSEEIVGSGGVAMAEDGTGGAVYLKRVGGVPHVFVARFYGGRWLAPQRVDVEEPFAASWPRIAAGPGGLLVVVWATAYATEAEQPVDELLGATLGQGSSTFGRAILVDPDIRSGVGTSPELVLSPSGQADVVYRVVHDEAERTALGVPLLRAGDVVEDVRMAHYNGERWSRLGTINRNPGVSMRPPTEANAPRIAIGPTGNGIVVWQEPEIEGVARIWARRFFGSSLDYTMPVSAPTLGGAPLPGDADAPSVALSRLGEAVVAYRQSGGPGSPLPGPRIFLNTLPDGEAHEGTEFLGAQVADPATAAAAGRFVGPPSVDVDEKQDLRLLYDAGGEPRVIIGTDAGLIGALSLGPAFAGGELPGASAMNPSGGGISAWPSADRQGHPAVAVREDFADGAVQTALLAGGAGGEVGEVAVARSGLGDALVSFRQGPFGNASIVAVRASAPPAPFFLTLPKGWVNAAGALVRWQEAPSANPPLAYHVVVDGHVEPTPAGVFRTHLDTRGLGEGRHQIQVLATDSLGQSTLTPATALLLADQPPRILVKRLARGRSVSVRIVDPVLSRGSVSVGFGDGGSARARASFTHRYARAGTYLVTVRAADRFGQTALVRRWVSVP